MSMFLKRIFLFLLAVDNFLNLLSTLRSFLTEIVHHTVIKTIHI